MASALKKLVSADLRANVPGARGLYGLAWSLAFSQGFQAVLTHRAAHFLVERGGLFKVLARVLSSSNAVLFGVYIDPDVAIGAGFALPHPVGVVIGLGAVVGEGVTIYQNVTIGQAGKGAFIYPRVGDRVTIYPGAVVVGDIDIGDDVVVGANAVVLRSFSAGQHVAGVPARVLSPALNRRSC
jgi:serine O-acetyltransferase